MFDLSSKAIEDPINLQTLFDPYIFGCGHTFDRLSFNENLDHGGKFNCHLCNRPALAPQENSGLKLIILLNDQNFQKSPLFPKYKQIIESIIMPVLARKLATPLLNSADRRVFLCNFSSGEICSFEKDCARCGQWKAAHPAAKNIVLEKVVEEAQILQKQITMLRGKGRAGIQAANQLQKDLWTTNQPLIAAQKARYAVAERAQKTQRTSHFSYRCHNLALAGAALAVTAGLGYLYLDNAVTNKTALDVMQDIGSAIATTTMSIGVAMQYMPAQQIPLPIGGPFPLPAPSNEFILKICSELNQNSKALDLAFFHTALDEGLDPNYIISQADIQIAQLSDPKTRLIPGDNLLLATLRKGGKSASILASKLILAGADINYRNQNPNRSGYNNALDIAMGNGAVEVANLMINTQKLESSAIYQSMIAFGAFNNSPYGSLVWGVGLQAGTLCTCLTLVVLKHLFPRPF